MVDMPHVVDVESEDTSLFAIRAHGEQWPVDLLDGGQLAVGDVKFAIGSGELDAVAWGEFAFALTVSSDALQASGIVGGLARRLRAGRSEDFPWD